MCVLIPALVLLLSLPGLAIAEDTPTAADGPALQRLIDGGGAVRLERRTYRIANTLTIDLDKSGFTSISGNGVARIVMAGPGPALRFVGTHMKSAAPADFEPRVWERQRMPLVDGVEIIGDHPESVGIEAVGTMQLTITRTRLQGLLHGIHLVKNNRNIVISDCHIYDNRGIGVFYDDVNLHQSNVVGCHISYNKQGGIVTRGGMVRNLQIGTCDIEANQDPKGPPAANILLDSTGGSTGEVAIVGCTVQHGDAAPNSANIRILGKGVTERQTDTEEGHVTIGENVLSDVRVNIELKHARGVTITGNTFWMGYDYNLLVEDSSNIVVGPNNMDRNPRYAHSKAETSTGAVLFRRTRDSTITGLHVNGNWHAPAAVGFEDCSRLNITGLTVLDSDNVNLLLKDVSHSLVSGCLIRDDRKDAKSTSLKVTGGGGNLIRDNLFGRPPETDPKSAFPIPRD
jgi:hypothetical protein